jgi:hypothetical protein
MVYESLLLQKPAALQTVDAQAPLVFESVVAETAYAVMAIEALLAAANALSDDVPILSRPCGAAAFDVEVHGEHVSSSAMEPAAANAYLLVAQQALNGIDKADPSLEDASKWSRKWRNSRVGLPAGALYVQPDGPDNPHVVDSLHVACDQIPIEEVAEFSLWNVTGGKVGHDVARILVDADFLQPGNHTIAVGAGPQDTLQPWGRSTLPTVVGRKCFLHSKAPWK